MAPPSEGIKDLLVEAGFVFAGTADWAVYIGKRPDNPERVITVYDSGGGTANPRWLLNYPSVQIRVRGQDGDYKQAYETAEAVKNKLLGLPSRDLNGDRWVQINMAGDIGFLGFNQNEQPEFVMNFNLIIEPADSPGDNRDPL